MPIFNYNIDKPPADSEVEVIEVIRLKANEDYKVKHHSSKEKILIAEGKILLRNGDKTRDYNKGDVKEFKNENPVKIIIAFEKSVIIRVGGNWNNETGSCGIFELASSGSPKNIGDETDYRRNTDFDNHFHDCDEFWILYEGSGEIVTEGNRYSIKGGDCVFTKAGIHHDFPIVNKTIKGAWFETSLIGEKREGHLWNHTHKKGVQN